MEWVGKKHITFLGIFDKKGDSYKEKIDMAVMNRLEDQAIDKYSDDYFD